MDWMKFSFAAPVEKEFIFILLLPNVNRALAQCA